MAFEELPTICRADGGPPGERLHAGDIYLRPTGKPETRKIKFAHEMRELTERVVDLDQAKLRRRATPLREVILSRAEFDGELGGFA